MPAAAVETFSSITPIEERPSWRGWMHAVAFMFAIPGGVLLIIQANGPSATVAASISSVLCLASARPLGITDWRAASARRRSCSVSTIR